MEHPLKREIEEYLHRNQIGTRESRLIISLQLCFGLEGFQDSPASHNLCLQRSVEKE